MIRVLLADDHPVVRAGLRGMLAAEADIEVAGEAPQARRRSPGPETGGFDVILMDLRMPGGDGVAATEHILAADPGARVLILTTYETDADILRAVEAGATGYLLKDATPAELAGAVRASGAGRDRARSLGRRTADQPRAQATARVSVGPGDRGVGPGRAGPDQRGDRPGPVHQRGHREDAPAARVRQAGRVRPHRGGDHRYRAGPSPSSGREPVTAATTRAMSVRSGRTTCAPAAARSAAG